MPPATAQFPSKFRNLHADGNSGQVLASWRLSLFLRV
jgi:hypothetical protein